MALAASIIANTFSTFDSPSAWITRPPFGFSACKRSIVGLTLRISTFFLSIQTALSGATPTNNDSLLQLSSLSIRTIYFNPCFFDKSCRNNKENQHNKYQSNIGVRSATFSSVCLEGLRIIHSLLRFSDPLSAYLPYSSPPSQLLTLERCWQVRQIA